jgi:hypothetical protein
MKQLQRAFGQVVALREVAWPHVAVTVHGYAEIARTA